MGRFHLSHRSFIYSASSIIKGFNTISKAWLYSAHSISTQINNNSDFTGWLSNLSAGEERLMLGACSRGDSLKKD